MTYLKIFFLFQEHLNERHFWKRYCLPQNCYPWRRRIFQTRVGAQLGIFLLICIEEKKQDVQHLIDTDQYSYPYRTVV